MTTFISTVQFTHQGMKDIQATCQRAASFQAAAANLDAEVKNIFWTLGRPLRRRHRIRCARRRNGHGADAAAGLVWKRANTNGPCLSSGGNGEHSGEDVGMTEP